MLIINYNILPQNSLIHEQIYFIYISFHFILCIHTNGIFFSVIFDLNSISVLTNQFTLLNTDTIVDDGIIN